MAASECHIEIVQLLLSCNAAIAVLSCPAAKGGKFFCDHASSLPQIGSDWLKMNAISASNSSVYVSLRACSHCCSAVFLVFIGAAAPLRSSPTLVKYDVKKSLTCLKHKRVLAALNQQVIPLLRSCVYMYFINLHVYAEDHRTWGQDAFQKRQ